MKRLTTLSCLLILQFSCCTSNKGVVHCDFITPCEILEKRRLTKDVHLENSVDIYEAVRQLVDQAATVETPPSGYPDLTLIWEANPVADEKTFVLDLKLGTSAMKMLEKIAARRGEHLTKTGNYVAITSSAKTLLPTYEQQGINPSTELKEAMGTFFPFSIILVEPDDDGLEEFLSAKLQQTLASRKNASAFRFVVSEAAKGKVGKTNLFGAWNYLDLCEALGQVADLRWRIEGTEIHLRDPNEK
jgi:hypothetical protein